MPVERRHSDAPKLDSNSDVTVIHYLGDFVPAMHGKGRGGVGVGLPLIRYGA